MAIWRSARAGLRRLLRPDDAERDLRDELAHYVDMATEDNIRRGMAPDDAARAARVSMGSLEGAKAEVRAFGWDGAIDGVRQDSRLAFRGLRRNPGFALTAVVSLALGVGALTIMFSLVNAVLLRPLPYRDADRLALIWTDDPRRGLHREGTAYATISDWQAQTRAFSGILLQHAADRAHGQRAQRQRRPRPLAQRTRLGELLRHPRRGAARRTPALD